MKDSPVPSLTLSELQTLIERLYGDKDVSRGTAGTFMWFMEEVGELATALRSGNDAANLREEFADVLAWLITLANINQVDLSAAIYDKYGRGCPGCGKLIDCHCDNAEKP